MNQPKVTFYPLKTAAEDTVRQFACRLAEKAFQLGHRVHLLVSSEADAAQLDELLWSFRDTSFLPHLRLPADAANPDEPGVTLGSGTALPTEPGVLINLTNTLTEHHDVFADIREIIPDDETLRDQGRQRYRYYRERGYEVETINL